MPLAKIVHRIIGEPSTVGVDTFDGSAVHPADETCTVQIRTPDALRRFLWHPGELGVVRGYVAGDIDLDGDIFELLELAFDGLRPRVAPSDMARLVSAAGRDGLKPLPPPPEEARVSGRRHSARRDAGAIAHHYDVSNEFYELVLGPAMTYSCAVFETRDDSLETAQRNKHELICRKLALEPGMRLLDVGCGWGSMLIHAAERHGVTGVGITISRRQAELAEKRVADAGLAAQIEIRLQDYRDLDDGHYDAVSSVGMLEHVGRAHMPEYNRVIFDNLAPGGRFLNHGICRGTMTPPTEFLSRVARSARRIGTAIGTDHASRIRGPLMKRYVFPDGELHDVGVLTMLMAEEGLEILHEEALREHYALTLRHWVANLDDHWDAALAKSSTGRARVWRLYMAASAVAFERGAIQVHQILAAKPGAAAGSNSPPLRPDW